MDGEVADRPEVVREVVGRREGLVSGVQLTLRSAEGLRGGDCERGRIHGDPYILLAVA